MSGGFVIEWQWALVVHILVSLAYFAIVSRFAGRIQALSESALVFFVPVFGLAIMLFARFVYGVVYNGERPEAHKLSNENMIFTNMMAYDENVIPLNDTFLLDDVKKKRRVFLDAVKQDVLQNAKVLKMATYDSDREIAYYAVSMLSSRIDELVASIADTESRLQKAYDEGDMGLLHLYARQLSDYVGQDFVDPVTKKGKRKVYLDLINDIMEKDSNMSENVKKRYIMEKIEQEINLGMYEEADDTCRLFQDTFPNDENAYLSYIRLYHAMRDTEKIAKKVNELKACPISLTPNALRVIRYWGGVANG